MKKLSEVEKITGLTRRQIQELEGDKSNIAPKPKECNKYGHLLYNKDEIKNFWQLSFYKSLDCERPTITNLVKALPQDREEQMDDVIESFEKELMKSQKILKIAKLEKQIGISYSSMRFGMGDLEEFDFDDATILFGKFADEISSHSDVNMLCQDVLSEGEEAILFDTITSILDKCIEGLTYNDEDVQHQVKMFHEIVSKEISDSIIMLSWYILMFAPDGIMACEIDKEYGEGKAEYLYKALRFYCEEHADNDTDKKFERCMCRLEDMIYRGYEPDSKDVQKVIDETFDFCRQIPVFSEYGQIIMFGSMGNLFGDEECTRVVGDVKYAEIFAGISKAIVVYCKNAIDILYAKCV